MYDEMIQVWKFDGAPEELKALAAHGAEASWVLWVPHALNGPDLEDEIRRRASVQYLERKETDSGDVVYIGGGTFDGLRRWLFHDSDPAAEVDHP